MTAKKDFKKRVRARQQKTGESYAAARAQVLGRRRSAGPIVEEYRDVTDEAARHGLRCRTWLSHELDDALARTSSNRDALDHVLERLVTLIHATELEAPMLPFRRVALGGEAIEPQSPLLLLQDASSPLRAFLTKLQLGMRGASADGRLLALEMAPDRQPPTVLVAHVVPVARGQSGLVIGLAEPWLELLRSWNSPSWVPRLASVLAP